MEMLRPIFDRYVPCLLGTLTITDVVDTSAGALAAVSQRLLEALQSQPIEITSVRIVPDSVESSHGDGVHDRLHARLRVWLRGKRVGGRERCIDFVPKGVALPPSPQLSDEMV